VRDASLTAYSAVFNYLAQMEDSMDVTFCCFDEKTAKHYLAWNDDSELKLVPAPASSYPRNHPMSRESIMATVDSDLTLFNATRKLSPCPVCGKTPEILVFPHVDGAQCIIQCKPWWRKAHMRVESCAAAGWWAEAKAKREWNAAIELIRKANSELETGNN
jgi:hypothetical protein